MTRHEAYWAGYRHGRRLHEHMALTDHEPALRLEVSLTTGKHRAWALGELRGYRQATGQPSVEGHRVIS